MADAKAERLRKAKERLAKFKDKNKARLEGSPKLEKKELKKVPPAVAPKKAPPPVAAKPKPSAVAAASPTRPSKPAAEAKAATSPSRVNTTSSTASTPANKSGDEYDETLSYEERSKLRRERKAREQSATPQQPSPSSSARSTPQRTPSRINRVWPPPKPLDSDSDGEEENAANTAEKGTPIKESPAKYTAKPSPSPSPEKPTQKPIETPAASTKSTATDDDPDSDQLNELIATMSIEIEQLKTERVQLIEDLNSAKAQVGKPSLTSSSSSSQLSGEATTDANLTQANRNIADLVKKVEDLEAQIRSSSKAVEDRDAFKNKYEEAQKKVTELVETMKSEVAAVAQKGEMENEQKTVSIRRLEIERQCLLEDKAGLQRKIDELQTQRAVHDDGKLKSVSEELKKVYQELEDAKTELELQRENAVLVQSSVDNELEMKNLEADVAAKKHAAEVADLQSQLAAVNEKLSTVEVSADAIHDSSSREVELKSKVAKLEASLRSTEQVVKSTEAELEESQTHLDQLAAESAAALEEAKTRVRQLETEIIKTRSVMSDGADPVKLGIFPKVPIRAVEISSNTNSLGIKIGEGSTFVKVEALNPDGVAIYAGIRVDDVILQIGTTNTKGLSVKVVTETLARHLGTNFRVLVASLRDIQNIGEWSSTRVADVEKLLQSVTEAKEKDAKELEKLRKASSKDRDFINALTTDLEVLQREMDSLKNESSKIELDDAAAEKLETIALLGLQNELAKIRDSERLLKEQVRDLNDALAKASAESAVAGTEIVKLRGEAAAATFSSKAAEADLLQAQDEIEFLTGEITRLRAETSSMADRLEVAKLAGAPGTPSVSFRDMSLTDIDENSSTADLRAVLATSMFARELERRDHLKVLTSLRKQNADLIEQVESWRAGDNHLRELAAREAQIRQLLREAETLKDKRPVRVSKAVAQSFAHERNSRNSSSKPGRKSHTLPKPPRQRSSKTTAPLTSTARRATSKSSRVALSTANTTLRLAGLTPIASRRENMDLSSLGIENLDGYMGYFDHLDPNASYAIESGPMKSYSSDFI